MAGSSLFRPSSWPSPTREEDRHHYVALGKDAIVMAALLMSMWFISRGLESAPLPDPADSPLALYVAAACAVSAAIMLLSDLLCLPPPRKDEPRWSIIAVVGHTSYFTLQTLFLQTAYFTVLTTAIYYQDGQLMALIYRLALWTNTQGVALTLLFFKLNWYEPKWRKNIMMPMHKMYPGICTVWLIGHVPSLPLGMFDMIFLRDARLLEAHGATLATVVQVAFLYGAVYLAWTKLYQHVLQPGTTIYPFIGDINSPIKAVGFVVVIGIAVSAMASAVHFMGKLTVTITM